MYYQMIAQCTQSLKNFETCLDKAERYAAAKKLDVGSLLSSRLAPDMQRSPIKSKALATMSKALRLGFQDRRHRSTRITSKRSTNCEPGFGKQSPSPRASRKRSTPMRARARSNYPGRPARSSEA